MSEDDALFGYRLRGSIRPTSVSEAGRVFGIHRSTYDVWKRRVERRGLEVLRPRERPGFVRRISSRRLSSSGSLPRRPEPERHVEAERPGELVGIDCLYGATRMKATR